VTAPTVERARPVDLGARAPRRRRRLRAAAVAAIVVLVGAAVWAVWFSSLLAVSTVRVVGVAGAPSEAVLRAARVPTGVPLARVDTEPARERVVALPWVRAVDVRRGWPSEIVVAVTPRVPIAAVTAAGRKSAVDAEGVAFDPPGPMPTGLPTVEAQGVGLTAAMAVLAELPPDLSRRVVLLSATTRDDVDLHLRSGDLVHWGSADQAAFKAEVLRALMTRKAQVYDVSAPELPTTFRPAS
jgi:cell division protein FtsQ